MEKDLARTMRRAGGSGWLRILGVAALSAAIVACGADIGGQSAESTETSATTETSAGTQGDGEVVLRFTSAESAGGAIGQSFTWWAEQVNERSNGQIEVEVFDSSSVAPPQDTIAAVTDGRATLGYLPSAYYPQEFPLWQVQGAPFVTDDAEAGARAFEALYENNEDFRAQFEAQGLRALFFIPIGSGAIAYTEPVTDLDQLEGLTLRSIGLWQLAMEAVGVNVEFIPAPDLYEALERNVIDGIGGVQMNSIVGLGWHEPRPHLTHPGLGLYNSNAGVISEEVFQSLAPEHRSVLEEVSQEYISKHIELFTEAEANDCQAILDIGGSVSLLPDEDVAEWRSVAEDLIWESWTEETVTVGYERSAVEAFVDEYLGYVAEHAGAGEYVDGMRRCAEGTP